MNDLEISRRLALAIGWQKVFTTGGCVMVSCGDTWRVFDHCEWSLAGPIGACFDCFPQRINGMWEVVHTGEIYRANTPQEAIAKAVIQKVEKWK